MNIVLKDQAKDTGMAMVLICLLLGLFSNNILFFKLAIFLLILDMVVPNSFYPLSIVWFGFSRILGSVVSKVILSIVFVFLVTPVGLIRRVLGKDSLRLKDWKKSSNSVLKIRDHLFVPVDLGKPY